jgi:hypothetical protein
MMANKEIHFRTRSETFKFNYLTGKSMHTDKATPSSYSVLQNATKFATFTEKSILLLEQWLPNPQFRFLHVLDFEAWRLHVKYMYISAISNSSTITVVFKSHLDDKVSTYFLH